MSRLYKKINQTYVDDDLEANKRVVNNQFKFVAQNNEPFKRPSILEDITVFNIDKYFEELKLSIQSIIDNYISGNKINNASKPISIYNVMVSYLKNFTKSHLMSQRDKAMIEDKFDELKPILKQAVDIGIKYKFSDIALLEQLLENIEDRHYIEIKLTAKQIKDFNEQIKRFEKPDFNIYVEKIDDMFKQISEKDFYVDSEGNIIKFSDDDRKRLLKKYEDFRTKLFKIRREPTLNTQLYEEYFKKLYNDLSEFVESYDIPNIYEQDLEEIQPVEMPPEEMVVRGDLTYDKLYQKKIQEAYNEFKKEHNWKTKRSTVRDKTTYNQYFTESNDIKPVFKEEIKRKIKEKLKPKEEWERLYPKLTKEQKKIKRKFEKDKRKKIDQKMLEGTSYEESVYKKIYELGRDISEISDELYYLPEDSTEREDLERKLQLKRQKQQELILESQQFQDDTEEETEGAAEYKGEEELTEEERAFREEFGYYPSNLGKGKPKKKAVKKVVKKAVKKTIKKAVKKVKKHPDDILFEFLEEKLDLDDE